MSILSLLLQVATLGLVAYVIVQLRALFREVRVPVVRQKGQLPADFRDRLRNMPRPNVNAEAPKDRPEVRPEVRSDRPDNRGDRNRDGRDRNRDGRDRDRNREGRAENREPRTDRPERSDRPEGRGDRPEGRNRDGRDRNRDDRGPRTPRPEFAAPSEQAPVQASNSPAESAPVSAPATAPAPSFGGRRPLGPVSSSSESAAVEPSFNVLAPSSLAQPVAEAPIRHGRRALPKAKPRFDDEPETTTESAT